MNPQAEYATLERVKGIEKDVSEVKGDLKGVHNQVQNLEIKSAETHLILGRIERGMEANSNKHDRILWAVFTSVLGLIGAFVWFVLGKL